MTTEDLLASGSDESTSVPPPDAPLDLGGRRRLAVLRAALFGEALDAEYHGRYAVQELLGSGATGEVFAAYDTSLERRVALKLLKPTAPEGARERLYREARVMAALDHPNLIEVHEIGDLAGQPFVAMELASGGTLERWLQVEPRSPAAVAAMIAGAARGLAVAHRAGLVHRDVKPSNIFVSARGDAKVGDFGLVRQHATAAGDGGAAFGGAPSSSQRGALVGTPAYMAPEQWRGEPASEACDQYALGVTLYEALYGERPWPGRAAPQSDVVPPRRGRGSHAIPGWLRRSLARSLRLDAAARFPSMDAFAAALENGLRRWRRRVAAAMAATATATAAAVGYSVGAVPAPPACLDEAMEALAEVWSPERADALATRLRATGRPHADAVAGVAAGELDSHAAAWTAAMADACEATRSAQGDTALARARVACLHDELRQLGSTLELAEELELDEVDAVLREVPARLDPARCLAVAGSPEPGSDASDELARRLARARVLVTAGRGGAAQELVASIRSDAEAIGDQVRLADAELLAATLRSRVDAAEEAAALAQQAFERAFVVKADAVAHEAALVLARVIGEQLRRAEEGRGWAKMALSIAERVGLPSREHAAALDALASVDVEHGEYEAALRTLDRAAALLDPEQHPRMAADLHDSRARALLRSGRIAQARVEIERQLEILVEVLGPRHPTVGNARCALATTLDVTTEPERLLAEVETAVEILSTAVGDEHRFTVNALALLAKVRGRRAQWGEAVVAGHRAVTAGRVALGPHDPLVVEAQCTLGSYIAELGDVVEARIAAERCLEAVAGMAASVHPAYRLSAHLAALDVFSRTGHVERAAELAARLPELDHESIPPDYRGLMRAALAEHHLAQGRPEDALRWAEAALQSDPERQGPAFRLGHWHALRAVAAAHTGDHALARSEAEASIADLERSGRSDVGEELAEMRALLAEPG